MLLSKSKPFLNLSTIRHSFRLSSCSSSSADYYLAEKALILLKRHPEHLNSLSSQLTPKAASFLLLKSQHDQTLILKFLNWAKPYQFFDVECKCLALHVLTRFKLYKSAQSLAEDLIVNVNDDSGSLVFDKIKDSFHLCNSSSSVFDLLVKSYSHLKMIDKAKNTIYLAKNNGFMPGVLSYNSVLDAMVRSRCSIDMAKKVFDDMVRGGITPNVFSFNILISGFCANGKLEKGLEYFDEMKRNGCLPNVVTYNTLIDGFCKLGSIDEAWELLKSMSSRDLEPNLISFNVIINGLCRVGRMKETSEVLAQMRINRLIPDEVTYNTLVNGYCKEGDFHQALILFEEMVRNGVSPNVVTYTALINSMCKARNLNRAMELLNQMRVRGLHPNARTYTTLIDGFSSQGFMDKAYGILNEMVVSGFFPSIVTYNTLIKGHCVLGRMEEALGVIRDMVDKGVVPDLVSYSTVISRFCKDNDVEKAFQIKQEMVAKGISPDAVTYSSLIQGLCKRGDLTKACDLFQEMLGMGLLPDEFTYTTLIGTYCEKGDLNQAHYLLDEMMQKGFTPDIVTYNVLINGLSKQVRAREAEQLLFKHYNPETAQSDATFDVLIKICMDSEFRGVEALLQGFCMNGLMNEADQVFELMLRRNCKPTDAIYNVLIHGHSRAQNVMKAFNLYEDLVHFGYYPNNVSLISLIKALSKEGMSEELNQVIGAMLRCSRVTESELAKALVEIYHKEGNMDLAISVLSEMAKDGLLPNGGKNFYAYGKW
ncbi:Pentatricopeptide repeat [Dillenia turbinata]|uniref:Pentatricopeptide repeat n=1 Tax=Dillenia turbinata TaxID=194707 RepID=A0AAN8UR69_9MAGN